MSYVTDLVFVLPDCAGQENWRLDFESRFQVANGYEPVPAECTGSKFSGAVAYHIGANYLSHQFVDDVLVQDWPAGTVLYLHDEQDEAPTVTVFAGTSPAMREVSHE